MTAAWRLTCAVEQTIPSCPTTRRIMTVTFTGEAADQALFAHKA